MKEKNILILIALVCISLEGYARESYDRGIQSTVFVPQHSYTGGVSVSYLTADIDDYDFLVLDGIDAKAYTFKISPHFAYSIKDDMAIGVRFSYKRSYANIGNIDIGLGDDLSFEIDHYRMLQHSYNTGIFLRTYMSLFGSKVVGFYNDLQLSYGYSQGKILNHQGKDLTGTYQTGHNLKLGARPGLAVFVMNNMAVDVSIDVMGAGITWKDQTRNQVEHGSFRSASADFSLNLLSVNIGVTTYF